jgi:hypothetical protein
VLHFRGAAPAACVPYLAVAPRFDDDDGGADVLIFMADTRSPSDEFDEGSEAPCFATTVPTNIMYAMDRGYDYMHFGLPYNMPQGR